jgi:hypothetical protein
MHRKDTQVLNTFSNTLKDLSEDAKHGPVPLKEILTKLSGRGKTLLAIFLCLPFGQFLGLAVPFGLLIAILGFKIALKSHSIWLPHFILKRKVHPKILKKILGKIQWPLKKINWLTHPRWTVLSTGNVFRIINGVMIGLVGICLAISLPIPLSSYIASFAIFLLGLGMLNDDGVLIAIAYPIGLFYIGLVVITSYTISLADIYHWILNLF